MGRRQECHCGTRAHHSYTHYRILDSFSRDAFICYSCSAACGYYRSDSCCYTSHTCHGTGTNPYCCTCIKTYCYNAKFGGSRYDIEREEGCAACSGTHKRRFYSGFCHSRNQPRT